MSRRSNYKKWLKEFDKNAEKIQAKYRENGELHRANCESYMLSMQKEKSRRGRK